MAFRLWSGTNKYNNEEIRIVMVGKTGAGKSATGNTILGGKPFASRFSSKSVTADCKKGCGEVDGQAVAVIDTPGLFDTVVDEQKTAKEVGQSISYAAPGPHIFLIVIKLGRFTEEEKKSVEKIQKIFGEEANRYSMVLFTNGDQLDEQTIEEFLSENDDLQELVDQCNGQYQVFNNKVKDGSQVRELLKKIRAITQKNGGRHYTNEMFQRAEEEIEKEKQRILKEKEEEIRKKEEELEKKIEEKYQQELRKMEAERKKQDELRAAEDKKKEEEIKKLKTEMERQAARQKEEEERNKQRIREMEAEKKRQQELQAAHEREMEEQKRMMTEEMERKARREAEESESVLGSLFSGVCELVGSAAGAVVGTAAAVGHHAANAANKVFSWLTK